MRVLLVCLLLSSVAVQAQEETTDIVPADEQKLEWGGNLDAKYVFFHTSPGTPMYRLQFLQSGETSSWLSQYRIEPYLNADYRTKDLGVHLKTHASYYSDDDASFDLFEAYGSYSPSFTTTLQAGKRMYNWGKGYAFNPVGYVNPVKDPENPELAQAGLVSVNVEYVKSFSSPALQTMALAFVVIPAAPRAIERYADAGNTAIALKAYALLLDTDIDLIGYFGKNRPMRLGLDASRNLAENLEVHGELSHDWRVPRYVIAEGKLHTSEENLSSYLVGLRYLHVSNTTVIAEYYHHGAGMNRDQFDSYAGFLANAVSSGSGAAAQEALELNRAYFRSSTLMTDYLYVKMMVPEPFDWLYFTPSIFSIVNLNDGSCLVSASLTYKPVTNVEFIVWPTFLMGGEGSEFGQKMVEQRIELWFRAFF